MNVVDRFEGDVYQAGEAMPALARRLKVVLRKLNPGAKWSVKSDGYNRVEAQLLELPAGVAAMAGPGEDNWAWVCQEAGRYCPGSERDYSPANPPPTWPGPTR